MENYIAQIALFGFNFAPRGWAFCNGQLLPIAQNQALFSLLGTTYGGDGIRTFQLPDLRGRRAIGQGQGQGLSPYQLGEVGGNETVALNVAQMPTHSHLVSATTTASDNPSPQNCLWAQDATGTLQNYVATAPDGAMAGAAIGNAGGGQGHPNLPPYNVANYCIALTGVFPSRN